MIYLVNFKSFPLTLASSWSPRCLARPPPHSALPETVDSFEPEREPSRFRKGLGDGVEGEKLSLKHAKRFSYSTAKGKRRDPGGESQAHLRQIKNFPVTSTLSPPAKTPRPTPLTSLGGKHIRSMAGEGLATPAGSSEA